MQGAIPDGVPWGKLSREDGQVVAWHPLVDHCIDVACVTEALLRHTSMGTRLAWLAGWASLDDTTVARLSIIAGLHDLGKANHGFQAHGRSANAHPVGHVKEALALLAGKRRASLGQVLAEIGVFAWDPAPYPLLRASIAHHGRYPAVLLQYLEVWREEPFDPIQTVRQMAGALQANFPDAQKTGPALAPGPDRSADQSFVHAWAGVVMLADWLGSDRAKFPYSEPEDPDRATFARRAASELLTSMGLIIPKRPPTPKTFREVASVDPRPAQDAVFSRPAEVGPSLVVLEAETGSGKTEAAFAHFARLYAAGEVDGMYFAVPTRAAATQLHGRIVKLTQRWLGEDAPPVVLAVPGLLRVDDVSAQRLAPFEVLWNDEKPERDRHRYWAGEQTKRYLVGAIAVGTIDQVLLSALRVDHAHLRASALLRQLLVVDEVHASDTYMSTLLGEVLRRHWRAGAHALLLSATLESVRRDQLLASATQRKHLRRTPEEAAADPYPALTAANGTMTAIDGPGADKAIQIAVQPWITDTAAITAAAVDAARRGARVLVIRNTVRGCMELQESLEREGADVGFRCNGSLAPHHSRFAPEDRRSLDQAVEAAFAPASTSTAGVVCVATQTVEQSLDIDADLLITDLCPVDVLLQRIGRLHRHTRHGRPEGFTTPTCVLLVPEGALRPGAAGNGLGSVYPHLGMLEATRREAEARPVWRIPRDNRALVERCLHPTNIEQLCLELGLHDHHLKQKGEDASRKTMADLGVWSPQAVKIEDCHIGAEEELTSTRWSEDESEDRLVSLPGGPLRSPFGHRITTIRIPGFFLKGVPVEAAVTACQRDEALEIEVGTKAFVYDRRGLRPA